MKSDRLNMINLINNNSLEIEKALETLSAYNFFAYCYMLVSDRLFISAEIPPYNTATNREDFLKGAYTALEELQQIPYLLREALKAQSGVPVNRTTPMGDQVPGQATQDELKQRYEQTSTQVHTIKPDPEMEKE